MDSIAGLSFSAGKKMDDRFKWYYKLFGWIIFGAPAKITLYGKSLIPFAKKASINENKVQVLTTGIELKKKGNPELVLKEFDIQVNEQVILFVGLLVPRKGLDIFVKTIARLNRDNLRVFVIGDGPNRKEYEKRAKELKVKIEFLGFRKDVFNFYTAADVLFFPSTGEGLPGVVMESLVSELPVVTSNIPCIPDLIDDKKNGFLCKMDDINCFTEKLSQLLDNADLRQEFRIAGLKKIESFEWSKVMPRYIAMYEQLKEEDSLF